MKAFLAANPSGVVSGDVIAHLTADERFTETLTRNATGGYNVISRLVKRGEIRKEGKILYPLNENDPPEGGSDVGEDATSPKSTEQEDHGDLLSYHS